MGARAALLDVALEAPTIDFNVNGQVSYDSATDVFTVTGTPTLFSVGDGLPPSIFFSGGLAFSIVVDEFGQLVGGVGGDDFSLAGDLDADGDFLVDYSGELLTGEIRRFGAEDLSDATDLYEVEFDVTGGLLAGMFAEGAFGLSVTSESSSFENDFTVDFGGLAKGQIGSIPEPGAVVMVAAAMVAGVTRRRASARRAA